MQTAFKMKDEDLYELGFEIALEKMWNMALKIQVFERVGGKTPLPGIEKVNSVRSKGKCFHLP